MTTISQKEYDILLVEPNSEIADLIVDSFAEAEIAITIAEVNSLIKASTLISSPTINFLILGPTLDTDKICEFFEAHSINKVIPSLYIFKLNSNQIDRIKAAGVSEILEYPYEVNILRTSLENALKNFADKKNKINTKTLEDSKSKLTTNIGSAHQLALILNRLTTRLNQVSTEIKKLPISTELKQGSISEAVNQVIMGATQFRKDKETEDLNTLINNLIK